MNLAVFASGRGSNFNAILHAIHQGILPAQVRLLITNNSNAGAIDLAKANGIPFIHITRKQFASDDEFDRALLEHLSAHDVDFIVLAGYMKRIPSAVVKEFSNRILNVHPALLPAFGGEGMYGHHVHEAVLASGAKVSGATVHLVNEEYDRGSIVMQKAVVVLEHDTPETLAQRVLAVEHEILPLALKAFAEERIRTEGTRTWVTHTS